MKLVLSDYVLGMGDGLGNPWLTLCEMPIERLYNKLKSLSNEVAMTRPSLWHYCAL